MNEFLPTTVGFPIDGQAYDLARVEDAAALSHRCSELSRMLRHLKERADDVLRAQLAEQAVTVMAAGEFEVSEDTGRASYDVQALWEGLVDAGMPEKVAEGLFVIERKVRDGKELTKLATRHDAYGKVIAAATTRSRGYIKVKARRSQAPAPRTPDVIREHVQAEARSEREAEADAAARGI
jgi:hypothetical protein